MEKKFEEFKDMLMKEYKKGNIVVMTIDGPEVSEASNFIDQPADGILYDLNRTEEVVLTYIEDEKWVNDYAVAKTIRELKKQIDHHRWRSINDKPELNKHVILYCRYRPKLGIGHDYQTEGYLTKQGWSDWCGDMVNDIDTTVLTWKEIKDKPDFV